MYIDQSVFDSAGSTPAAKQAFDPLSMLTGGISPYNVMWDFINYGNKRKQQDYAKALQKHLEEREDTAYQRAAKDMENAGLNPLNIQGSASSGANVSMPDITSGTPADSIATTLEKFVNNANNTMLAMDSLKNSENERKLNTMRTLNEVANIRANIKNTNIDSKSKQQLLDHMEREYKNMEKNGLYDYDNGIAQQIKTIVTFITSDLPQMKAHLIEKYPYLKSIEEFMTSGKLSQAAVKKLKEEHPTIYFILNAISDGQLTTSQGEQILNGTEINETDSSHSSGKFDSYMDVTRPKWWQNLKK